MRRKIIRADWSDWARSYARLQRARGILENRVSGSVDLPDTPAAPAPDAFDAARKPMDPRPALVAERVLRDIERRAKGGRS
jgi:hypothetical protein